MGKYPVIFISLKGVDGFNFEEACGALRRIIRAEASRFRMLLSSEKIADEDKQMLLRILQEKDTFDDVRDSLRKRCKVVCESSFIANNNDWTM